jgi:hypothetical protein
MTLRFVLSVVFAGFCSTSPAQGVLEKTAVLGPTAKSYLFRCSGAGNTTCQAQCAPGEALISGGCALASGAGALQNAWVSVGANGRPAFSCTYQGPTDIYAQALCSSSPTDALSSE